MKKKVKKIPKFNSGGTAYDMLMKTPMPVTSPTFNPATTNPQSGATAGTIAAGKEWKDFNKTQKANAVSDAIGGVAALWDMASSGQDVSVGTAVNGMATGAQAGAAFGPVGMAVGAGLGLYAGTAGRGNKVDVNSASEVTSNIAKKGSGWLKLLGMSDEAMYRRANMVANANIATRQSEDLKANYYNNPNVPGSINVFAAEGGIIPNTLWYEDDGEYGRTPYGEIYKEPEQGKPKDSNLVQGPAGTQILSDKLKYPGTKDTFAKHYEKSIAKVKNYGNDKYAKNSQLLNDKYAQKQFDEHLAVQEEMKNKKIKKVKNGIPAHEGGENGTTPALSDMFLYRQKDGKFVMQDINGNRYDVPEMMLPYIQGDEHGYWFGPQTGVAPSAGKWNGSMNFAKQMLNSKNVAKLRNTMTKVLPKGVKPATPSTVGNGVNAAQVQKENMLNNDRTFQMWQRLGNKGGVPAKTVESNVAAYRDASKASRNLWELTPAQQAAANASAEQYIYDGMVKSNLPYWLTLAGITGGGGTFLLHEATKDKQPVAINTSASMPVNTNGQTVVITQEKPVEPVVTSTEVPTENEKKEVVVPKKSSINKPSSSKKTAASRVTTSTAPSPEDTVVRRPIYEEPVKTVTVPTDDTKVYGRDGRVAYDYAAPETKVTPQDLGRTVDDNNNYTGSDWRDGLYRMAVLSQPLWDRAKAEPVDYTSPVYKYMPTQIDVSSQLRDADQSYALSRYNFANLYPNTGAGMAAGLQAASNRAKQYADIRQWQTNAQNELIGKNVGIYNNWANEHARILNDVYNKSAQNRAAARNINRQNRAAALSNWGTMLSDDKKMNLEAQNNQLKANILKPLIESVYENSDELIPMLAPYTMNRNVKKKSSTR